MPCRVVGSGNSYPVGSVITGQEVFSLALSNSNTTVTTKLRAVNSNYFTIWMDIVDGGNYPVFDTQYGCYGYFTRSGVITDTYEAEIVENNDKAVEIALRCNNFTFSGNGIAFRDVAGALNYAQGQVNPNWKYITSARVTLSVRVEEGKQGVFLGWHSYPRIGPDPFNLSINAAENNNPDYAERELGVSGIAVAWSSKNPSFVSRHPTWGAKSEWTTAEGILGAISNHGAWCGIDDATYAINGDPAYAPTQHAGFPNTQLTPPWFVGFIQNNDVAPVAGFVAMRKPIETIVSQFDPVHRGSLTCHFCNEWADPTGNTFPFQIFIGAFKYVADTSNVYINEPKQTLRNKVGEKVMALEWPGEEPRAWLRG